MLPLISPFGMARPHFKYRFPLRVWNGLKEWLGLVDFDTNLWEIFDSLDEWL
jgi:hypothetical protein